MKKNILIIIVILAITAAGIWIYSFQSGKKAPVAESQGTVLAKEDFSILAPDGWEQVQNSSLPAVVVYAGEEITETAAKNANFKTYYSVNHDTIGSSTIDDYAEYIRQGLNRIFKDVKLNKEAAIELNGQQARSIEMEIKRGEVDLKVLTLLVSGNKDDIWIVSFNATKNNWEKYQELFQEIALSFEIK